MSADDYHSGRPIVLHDCGERVLLFSDWWGLCPRCEIWFYGRNCQVVTSEP